MSKINLIFAQSLNGIIGNKGDLPWHLPDELKEFKEKTMGSVVVMGRKTWDSLPEKMKPLPNRFNIVIKKDSFRPLSKHAPGLLTSISDPIGYFEKLNGNNEVWVIGGKSIYELALPYANELHITTVMITVDGDTLAPEIDFNLFDLISQSRIKYDSKTNTPFYTSVYRRK